MMQNETITCPECGTQIQVNDVLTHQVEERLRKELDEKAAEREKELQQKLEHLEADRKAVDEAKKRLQEDIDTQVKAGVEKAQTELRSKLKAEIAEEQADRLKQLEEDLKEKSDQVKQLHRKEAEIERLKRDREELEDKYKAQEERRITEERQKVRKELQDANELKLKESNQTIEELKKQLADMQRRAEQGSMQRQGEVQELAIEEWLRERYPLDSIEEIKKGAQGADCLQVVNTREREACGTIYYESKRTKNWSPSWIAKFKEDIRAKGADVGVLVTEAMPADMERMGMVDGIWVCSFDEFKALSEVLRQTVISVAAAGTAQENRGGKMELLYDYLTGNEFRGQVEAIVEGFMQMKVDLDKERVATQKHWKQREKQIEKVLLNTSAMHGSIRGIAGSAVPEVKLLELPGADERAE